MSDIVIVRARTGRGAPSGAVAFSALALLLASPAQAALVSACSGVSLPPSALVGPGSGTTPPGLLTNLFLGLSGPLSLLGVTGIPSLISSTLAGQPISLSVLKTDGTVLGPTDTCNTTSDSYSLNAPKGLSIGGNQITGLGGTNVASAGEINSVALGNNAKTAATAQNSVALGVNATVGANSNGAVAVGQSSAAGGANAVALGARSVVAAGAAGGVAIGNGATASYAGGIAIGNASVTGAAAPTGTGFLTGQAAPAAEASFGAAGAPRRLTNVADGAAATDAVTVAQLTVETTRRNALGAATAATLGGGAAYNPATGTVSTPAFAVQGTTYNNVGAALGGLDAQVTTNTTKIAGNTTAITNLSNGTTGTVVRAPVGSTLLLTAAGGTPAAPGTPQVLSNLANGAVAVGSKDAVTGDQLNTTNTRVTTNTTNIAGNTTAITNLTNGTAGLVQQTGGAPGNGQITVGAATGGTSVSVAGTGGNRVISGVADGVAPSDAATVGQIGTAVGTATANAVQYDTAGGVRTNSVTLAGGVAGPVTVTNVAPGALAAASTDAVNGSQLFATNTQVATNTGNIAANTAAITTNAGIAATGLGSVATNLGGGSTFDPVTGTVSAPAYTVQGTTYNNVGSALGGLDTQVTTNTSNIAGNTTAITNLSTGLNNGTVGLVQQTGGAPGNGQITIGAATGGTSVSVAGTGGNRVISGVADGVAPSDAATVGQIGTAVGTATANAVQYDTAGGVRTNSVTLAGGVAGPVTVTNVAPGALAAASTDAVNGSQLFATNTQVATNTGNIAANTAAITTNAGIAATGLGSVATNLGGGSTFDPVTGTVSAPAYTVQGTTYNNVGSALGGLDTQVTTNTSNIAGNTTAITNLSTGLNNGTVGLVQQTGGAPGNGQITIGAATGGTSVSVAGTGGNRVISGVADGVAPSDAATVGQIGTAVGTATANAVQYDTAGGVRTNSVTLAGGAAGPVTVTNVAPGALAAASTDAVNGSQLFATNTQVATNTGNIAANTAAITTNAGIAATGLGSVATNLGGGSTFDPVTGTVSAPAYTVQGTTYNNVGSALGGLDAGVTNNTTAIANINGGTSGTVVRAPAGNTLLLTAAGGTPAAPGTPQVLTNLANGAVAAGSKDAVTGDQLNTVTGQVAANTTAITNNSTAIAGNTTAITNLTNGTAGLVQQTGGAPGNGQITVGAATGGTSVSIAGTAGNRTLTGLKDGINGSDAVTVAQINNLTGGQLNVVQYDTAADGGRSNTISLTGGAPGGVAINNVAAAPLTATSTGAVNGSQLYATNTNVSLLLNGQAGAFQANNAAGAATPVASGANAVAGGYGATATGAGDVALGAGATSTGTGSVAIGQGSTDGGQTRVVSVGSAGNERRVTNVAPALNGTDAVNLAQLQAATTTFGTTTAGLQNQVNGLQSQLNQTNFDLSQVRRRANGGTAGAMAVAGLPQAFEPGRSMIGGAVGYWQDQVAFAIGVSSIVGDHTVVKAGGSISNQGIGGFNAGIGFQF